MESGEGVCERRIEGIAFEAPKRCSQGWLDTTRERAAILVRIPVFDSILLSFGSGSGHFRGPSVSLSRWFFSGCRWRPFGGVWVCDFQRRRVGMSCHFFFKQRCQLSDPRRVFRVVCQVV